MFSHPGKDLKEHLNEVKEIGLMIFDSKNNNYTRDSKIRRVLEIALSVHDYGKGTKYFQDYLKDQVSFKAESKRVLKAHAYFSAVMAYYLIKKELHDKKMPLIGAYIVLRHHGSLNDFEEERFLGDKKILEKQVAAFNFKYFDLEKEKEEIVKFFSGFNDIDFFDDIEDVLEEENLENYILINYLFSILISADKGAAIYGSKEISFEELKKRIEERIELPVDLVDKYKEWKFKAESKPIDIIREKIYRESEEEILKNKDKRIFSLNVPTGSGKTLTVFNNALKLREKLGENHRIIYNLPFTSIIDQNFEVFNEILGEEGTDSRILLKHHYLSQKKYNIKKGNEETSLMYDLSEYYIENWNSEIIVTTFVQFFQTLFSNENRKLKKYHTLSNSIIILDEIQSVPHKYWKLLNEFLKVLSEKYNTYVILVTATMPLIFDEESGEIHELVKKKEDYFRQFQRIRLDKSEVRESKKIDEFLEMIPTELIKDENKSYLFVMNTIKSSLKVYKKIQEHHPEREIYYLSTNIVPKERVRRIEEIKRRMKQGSSPILVSTQLIEAGVDMDFDIVYRDYSTLDSINQTCGRCNRNGVGKEKGIVRLFKIKDEKKDYSRYIYESFLLEQTERALKDFQDVIDESNFFDLSKRYFQMIKSGKSDAKSDKLLDIIRELKYDQIEEFELIPKEYTTVDIFIEADETAANLYQKYKNIMELEDKYRRKENFDRIKSDFMSYVISVPEKFFKEGGEGINYIDQESLLGYYDHETGFKREKEEDYYF